MKTALKIIFCISIIGILFSGYLSYNELVKQVCPIGSCSSLLGLPVCLYGFIMYLAIFIISLIGLKSKEETRQIRGKIMRRKPEVSSL